MERNATTEPSIKVEKLTCSFGAFEAVKDLDFDAQPGQVIGLLGPNGAGKTTTIRVLTTILRPTAGKFWIAGLPQSEPQLIRQKVGVLPESAGYPEHWTGRDYLEFHAAMFGRGGRDSTEIASSLLHQVALDDQAGARIAVYSRGMRQRLGVARALINDPAVIFLDEPTLGLDPAGQRQILELIQNMSRERGATVILSTHFLDEVEEVCSEVIILNHGKAITRGTVADIKAQAGPGRLRLRVPADSQESALALLRKVHGVAEVLAPARESGWIVAGFGHSGTSGREPPVNATLRALINASIPIHALEREGGRLSDAFLALTQGEEQ